MSCPKELKAIPEVVEVPAGRFSMGRSKPYGDMYVDEVPAREVPIESAFAAGKYPVSFEEFMPFLVDKFPYSQMTRFYEAVIEQYPRLPAVMVTWHEARAYCDWLSIKAGTRYRLLTEAEWEYVCRAGTTTEYWWGDEFDGTKANNRQDYLQGGSPVIPKSYSDAFSELKMLTPVDRFPPNPWGVVDTHGNAWEWVEDIYDDPRSRLAFAPRYGSERYRANRGGSWMDPIASLRSAVRSWAYPTAKDRIIGFRIAHDL